MPDAIVTCATAGWAIESAPAAAAASAAHLKCLAAMFPNSPQLDLVKLRPVINVDAPRCAGRPRGWLCGAMLTGPRRRRRRPGIVDHARGAHHRSGNRAAKAASVAADDRGRRITRSAIHVVPKVVHADRLDDRIVLFAGLTQHEAEAADFLSKHKLLRVDRRHLKSC